MRKTKNKHSTPQSLLDDAVYHFNGGKGMLASDSIWLCGSLALKNFALAKGHQMGSHGGKTAFVFDISEQSGEEILSLWKYLERHVHLRFSII